MEFSRKSIILFGILFLLGNQVSLAAEEPYWCFILSGQSNMAGRAPLSEAPEELKTVPSNVELYVNGAKREFSQLSEFGPEVAFAHSLAESFPDRKILLIKYAVGGTSLLAWAPEWDKERAGITGNASAGALYNRLFQYIERSTQDKTVIYKGVLWMQGERDAKYPAAAVEYYDNFVTLIQSFRDDLDSPKLPFLYGLVNPPASSYPGLSDVRKAQFDTEKKVTFTKLINTDSLSKLSDNLHYDVAGQLELGRLFAESYVSLVQSVVNQNTNLK
jgi:hypothetical protein